MSYSVSTLQTVADCDVLLSMAAKDKSDLQFRQLQLQRQQSSYAQNALKTEDELQAVDTELDAINTIVSSLPDGSIKDENIIKQKRLELKKFLLTERKNNYGSIALLDKELDVAQVALQIAEVDAYIAAITAHKATL